MPNSNPHTLVSTAWLAEHVGDANVRIIDASWYLPNMARDARAEYEAEHIEQAVFFAIDEASDTSSSLPHMLPSAALFTSYVEALGIGRDDQVIIYDGAGVFSSARVWWMFKYFGHDQVAVLDGGLPKWRAEGRAVTQAASVPNLGDMNTSLQANLLRSADQVHASAHRGDCTIVDARPQARFRGEAAEPRASLRSGHIPNSRNVPFTELLGENGTFKHPDELRSIFEAAGVDLTKPAITTCGSGVTAAILSLALEQLGVKHALYDGSWAEWGMDSNRAVATGEA